MIDEIKLMMQESMKAKQDFVSEAENIEKVVEKIVECFEKGNKILIFGNGGSAADAQHIAGEIVGRFKLERKGLPAIALTTDTSVLTAWTNDYEYDSVFSRQVEALAKSGDVLLGISTSGNSENVTKAFEKGKEIETFNISLTGKQGGKLKEISDLNINSSSEDTPRIQECHVLAYHIICELVEKKMFKLNSGGDL
jgi:D-sedoheptulose 7-phosphate isomerase